MLANTEQIKRIHALLAKTGLMSQKAALVEGATYGKQTSTKQMSHTEADALIEYLNHRAGGQPAQPPAPQRGVAERQRRQQACNTMRRKILAKCHRLKWQTADGKVCMQRLNQWCLQKSYLLKPLNQYTYDELPALVSQFEEVYKYYIKKIA